MFVKFETTAQKGTGPSTVYINPMYVASVEGDEEDDWSVITLSGYSEYEEVKGNVHEVAEKLDAIWREA